MLQIDFGNHKLNIWNVCSFAAKNNLQRVDVLYAGHKSGAVAADESALLARFVEAAMEHGRSAPSQLLQDVFAALIVGENHPKTFLEFGATNGVDLSNSLMLERSRGWSGALAEPSPQWHQALKANRPDTLLITDCIWSETGQTLDFFVSDIGELSTLSAFVDSDKDSVFANAPLRKRSGTTTQVSTISLNDVIEGPLLGEAPSYMSVDTEGSEFDILSAFDFTRYRPVVLTVEHNKTQHEAQIDALMDANGYTRVFRDLTAFDAWFVESTVLAGLAGIS